MLQDGIGVSCQEDDEIDLLGFVRQAYDVFISEYFKQQHEHSDEMQKIADQLEYIHSIYNYTILKEDSKKRIKF